MQPVEEIIDSARRVGQTMIEVRETVHPWKTTEDQCKLAKKLFRASRSDRCFLLCGDFAVAIGQHIIRNGLIPVSDELGYSKPPPSEDAILLVAPNTIWFGDWFDWLDDSPTESQNEVYAENSDKE